MQFSFTATDLRLDTLDAISAVIGRQETAELLQSLVASLESAFAEMRLARVAGDFASIARAAHRLAGGCGSLGAIQLQEKLRILERAALDLAVARCDEALAHLPQLSRKLGVAVDRYTAVEAIAG